MAKGTVGQLLIQMRADLGQLRVDVKEMENTFKTSFTNIQNMASNFGRTLASAFGIGLGIDQVIRFGKEIIELGSHLKDLSDQTGISVQTLSGIKSVVEENGSSLDAFATGIFRLQKELGTITDETDPAALAIKQLGLNFKELQNASPDRTLQLITDALAKQQNPINLNALAFQLLGKSARELIPAVLELAGKIEELRQNGLTPADVKILDDFADGITRFSNAVKIALASDLAGVFKEFKKDIDFFNASMIDLNKILAIDGVRSMSTFTAMLQNTEREALRFYEAVLKIIRAAPLLFEFLSGGKLNFNSKMWTDMINNLQDAQSMIGRRSFAEGMAGAEERLPGGFTLPIDKKALDTIKQFIESLQKQLAALQGEQIALTQGKAAGTEWKLVHDAMALGIKNLTPEMRKFIDQIVKTQDEIDQFKFKLQALQLVEQENDDATQKWQQKLEALEPAWAKLNEFDTSNLDDYAAAIKRVNDEFAALILAAKAAKDQGLVEQLEAARGVARVRASAAVETTPDRQLQAQLDQTATSLGSIHQQMALNADMAKLMGANFDQTSAAVEAQRQEVQALIQQYQSLANAAEPVANTLDEIKEANDRLTAAMKDAEYKSAIEELVSSIGGAIDQSVQGIIQGTQTLSEAMRNMARNIMIAFAEELMKLAVLNPIMNAVTQMFTGKAGGLNVLDIGRLFGFGASTVGGTAPAVAAIGGGLPFATGGLIPAFANGGLFIGHGGEYVMQKKAVDSFGLGSMDFMNKTGKFPGGSAPPNLSVVINGDVIPKDPSMSPQQIVQLVAKNIHDDQLIAGAIKVRIMRNSGGNQ